MVSTPLWATRAAATDESTPPDIATTTRTGTLRRYPSPPDRRAGEGSQHLHEAGDHAHDVLDVCCSGRGPEAEAQRVLRACGAESHGLEHVLGLERPGRTGRTGGHGNPFEVERNQG